MRMSPGIGKPVRPEAMSSIAPKTTTQMRAIRV